MRISDLVTETFNSSYPYKFVNNQYYFSTSTGNEYKVWFSGNNEKVEIVLALRGENDEHKDRIANVGDSQKVFGTVIDIVKDYINKNSPKILVFAADKREPSRIRLYNALAARADRALPNYKFVRSFDNAFHRMFYVVKNGEKISKKDLFTYKMDKSLDAIFENKY